MIGSGLKKFATENGLKVAKGVAYGSLRGFAATLSEGSGYKSIVLTTKFTDTQKRDELQAQLNSRNITRDFRVRSLNFAPDGISIVFNDTVGTMGKIKEFTDWFFPCWRPPLPPARISAPNAAPRSRAAPGSSSTALRSICTKPAPREMNG